MPEAIPPSLSEPLRREREDKEPADRRTLVFIDDGHRLLLGLGQRSLVQGKRNGYGGKLEDGDASPEARAIQELREETGLEAKEADLNVRGVMYFYWRDEHGQTVQSVKVFVYALSRFQGNPQNTAEMQDHRWYPYDRLPYANMFPGDRIWLPAYLSGQSFRGQIVYSPSGEVLSSRITYPSIDTTAV